MLYSLYAPLWDTNEVLRRLLREVLGYNEDEINKLESEHFGRNIANNLSIEQAKVITEIFGDNDFGLYLNDGSGVKHAIAWTQLGIPLKHEPPRKHYCDEPLVSREQLADLSIPKKLPPPERGYIYDRKVECPYCHSTNTKKIHYFSWLGMVGKQFHCNNCNANF